MGHNNSNIDHTLILKKFKNVEKNHLKMLKENVKIQNYKESLINYKEQNSVNQNSVFEYPDIYSYFYVFQNALYFTPLKLEIKNSTRAALFLYIQLPYKEDNIYIDNLFVSLIELLKMKKPLTYYEYVTKYKLNHNLTSCFLDEPVKYFNLIDNNLCFINLANNEKKAITDSFIQQLFKNFNLPLPTYYERKKIFYSLAKMAMEVPNNTTPYENPYYINYSIGIKSNVSLAGPQTKDLYEYQPSISIEYCKNNKMLIRKKVLNDSNSFYKSLPVIEDSLKFSESYYPIHFSKLLYSLTDGNIETVDNLSEVFACILASRNISNKLTVFHVPEKEKLLAKLLCVLVNYNSSYNSLKFICDSKNIKNLINSKLSGTLLNVSLDNNLPEFEKVNILNKILTSKPVSAKDGYIGKKVFINNMHLVYITSKDINITKLSNNYNINLIKLNTSSPSLDLLISSIENSTNELQWIQTQFALHGLKRIAERELKINSKLTRATTLKPIICNAFTNFINLYCEVKPTAECYAADIYKSYVEFYNTAYGGEPMSRINFVKLLKFSGEYKYYRPHHSSKDNRFAFLGISVDLNKMNALQNSKSDNLAHNYKENALNQYLKSMNIVFSE